MMVDTSELEGRSFVCLEGCGMCCLCQPELSDEELKIFETDQYLKNGLTREHVDGRRTAKPNAIKLQGECGACNFLKNRLCTIHEIKPHFCRQFPVHIHLLRRVQLNVNLSCRGVTDGGSSLKTYGKTLVTSIPESVLNETLAAVKNVVHDFDRMCHDAGIFQTSERMRSVATRLLPVLAKEDGIGKLLAFADDEPEIGSMPEDEVAEHVLTTGPAKDLEIVARDSNYEQFNLSEIAKLPVYVDEKFNWNLIQSKDGEINWMVLEEDGTVTPTVSIDPAEIGLLRRDDDALRIFSDYAKILISRDAFLGNAYNVCDMHDYRHDLVTVYLGVLGTTMLDLWWRTSLLGKVYKAKKIDGWLAREGVKAFDMDCLDAPTLGAFI